MCNCLVKIQKVPYILLTLIIIIFSGCATDIGNLKDEANIHYRLGDAHLRAGNTISALKELTLAVERDPQNPLYHHTLGIAYYTKGFNEEAVTHLRTAISLDSKFSDAHTVLGTIYLVEERWDEAISEFKMALSNVFYLTPEEAYSKIGWAYYQKGDYNKAIESLRKGIKANPQYSPAYNNLGLVYLRLDKDEEAEAAFQKAIQLFPEYVDAYYYMGLIYIKLKEKEKAREYLQRVIDLSSGSDLARLAKEYLELLNK